MKTLEDELVQLLDDGVVFDRSEKPFRPIVTIVGTQRSDRLDVVEEFLAQLQQIYPHARLVVGDTSSIEKEAVRAAQMIGMNYEVVAKGEKGAWDEGSLIRDERVVAKATHVVVMDESARSKTYKQLAERAKKHFSVI